MCSDHHFEITLDYAYVFLSLIQQTQVGLAYFIFRKEYPYRQVSIV